MLLSSSVACSFPSPSVYFGIQVVDEATGRGVPLAQIETVNHERFITDSKGFVAFDEPGLMERRVFFSVSSPGYEYPKDAFGYSGATLLTHAGVVETIKLKRINIAERLCRLTGQGIYRDSELLGRNAPISQPVLNGGVMGQDTAQAEIYKGQMFWFWGDTDRTDYPLGNFHTTGAIATLPKGKTDAGEGLEFRYFQDGHGFVRPMVPSADSHPIWVSGLTVLGSGVGQEMFAYYAQMQSLDHILNSGYAKWSNSREQFEPLEQFSAKTGWRFLDGHTVHVAADGITYALGGFPPAVRVRADEKDLLDPSAYEAFTCLNRDGTVLKNSDDGPAYRWQKEAGPIGPNQEQGLISKGELSPDQAHFLPLDSRGEVIFPHSGSVHWNEFRHKWIAVFVRLHGRDSELGEVYYSESDAPTGPFKRAVKICTHGKYTFYNPVQHPFLDRDGGRTIYFEGTYTSEFSGNPNPTPRYNYNQLLYRLDLADPRLAFAEETR